MADDMRARQPEMLHELRKLRGLARDIRMAKCRAAQPVAHATPGEYAMSCHERRDARQRLETIGENPAMNEHHGIACSRQTVLESHTLKHRAFPRLRIHLRRDH